MKNMKLLVPLALCLLATTSCQQDELVSYNDSNNVISVNATMEEVSSRSSVTNSGIFSWEVGDEIGVWATNADDNKSSFQCLSFKEADTDGKGIFEAVLDGAFIFSQYAVYPYSKDHTVSETALTVTLPDTYDYTGKEYTPNTNALMVANIGEETAALGDLNFYHAGGVVSVKLSGLPAGTCGVRLTTDKGITGNFDVTIDSDTKLPTISETTIDEEKPNNSVTIKFDALESTPTQVMQFFFPVPVGEYIFSLDYLKAAATAGDYEAFEIKAGKSTNKVDRRQLILMPSCTVVSTGANGENAEVIDYKEVKDGDKITYMVYTAKGLQAVNTLLTDLTGKNNEDIKALMATNITLVNDIDLTNAPTFTEGDYIGSNWKPLGKIEYNNNEYDFTNPYTGAFDGNGKTIKGLIIKNSATLTASYQALIRALGTNGVVKSLTLEDCRVEGTTDYGFSNYAGIVARNEGSIENCKIKGINIETTGRSTGAISSINKGKIMGCYISGNVTLKGAGVGCVVGLNHSTVSDCHIDNDAIVSLNSSEGNASGIVGINGDEVEKFSGTVSNCSFEGTGTITVKLVGAGGIVGFNYYGTVSNCSVKVSSGSLTISSTDEVDTSVKGVGGIIGDNRGAVSGCSVECSGSGELLIKAEQHGVGGIIGWNQPSSTVVSGCKIINKGNGITVKGSYNVGGIVGNNDAATVISCYAEKVNLIKTFVNTEETIRNSLGGIVGMNNGHKFGGGTIIACYANQCTNNGAALEATANVVGDNTYTGGMSTANQTGYKESNGVITACYYYAKGTTETKVTPVATSGTNNETLSSGEAIEWGDASTSNTAVYLMKAAIDGASSVEDKYHWGGTYSVPTLTK